LINIIHIIRSPGIGGAEILVKNIINSDFDENYSHYLFCLRQGPLLNLINYEKRRYIIQTRYKSPILSILNFRRIVKNYNIQIIHVHQPVDVLYALFSVFGQKVKILRTYHGFSGLRKRGILQSIKLKLLNFITNKFVCLNLFVSDIVLQHFRSINPSQEHRNQRILHNGIDFEELKNRNGSSLRSELNFSDLSILIGMIGSFNTKARDHYTICKALPAVLEIYPEVKFLFIGNTKAQRSGSYDKCYAFCREHNLLSNVHFMGERNDIGAIINSLDLYVHSSYYETFGLALVEAMACGIPCIASDIPAFREITDNGMNISLFETGNVVDLSKKIILGIKNIKSSQTQERVFRAMDYVHKRFSIEAHKAELHKFYKECRE